MNPFLFALKIWFHAQIIYMIALLCVSGYIHFVKPWIPFLNPFTIFESLAIVAGIVVFFLFVISLWLANGRFETPRALLIYACSTAMASCLSIGLLLPAMFPHAVHSPFLSYSAVTLGAGSIAVALLLSAKAALFHAVRLKH